MFETLLAATVAFYRAHHARLACYGLETPDEIQVRGVQATAWLLTTPPWSIPAMQAQLAGEWGALLAASAHDQYCFFTDKHAAIHDLRPAVNDTPG